MKKFDVITFGRSSIDLYSQNIGSPFNDIKGFVLVGGSPLNIAVGCADWALLRVCLRRLEIKWASLLLIS